jgi:DNA-directed RNA polymerase specialized sigma24 family protein
VRPEATGRAHRTAGSSVRFIRDDPFVTHRSLLFTVAYEMLGRRRRGRAPGDLAAVGRRRERRGARPRAYLLRIVTRQALNRLWRYVSVLLEELEEKE